MKSINICILLLFVGQSVHGQINFMFGPSAKKTIYVASQLKPCVRVEPMPCLQIRMNEQDDWLVFYGEIRGFKYEEGFEYKLKVKEIKEENPAAEFATINYELIKVKKKTASKNAPIAKEESAGNLKLSGQWIIAYFVKDGQQVLPETKSSYITFNEELTNINGNTGCNIVNGAVVLDGKSIKFGPLLVTKRYCEQGADQEQEFLAALEKADSYAVKAGELTLMQQGKAVMVLESLR